MDYGAFVDLGGLDGLIHVSEITHRRGIKPSEFVKVGDIVDVKIIRIDKETGKLSLSLKQMMADPWIGAENKYSVGTPITGRVSKVENFGDDSSKSRKALKACSRSAKSAGSAFATPMRSSKSATRCGWS